MELRHLRYFVAVAEELHFARAAERLHLAQQPLSFQIKQLEEELGVLLFHRTTRHVTLTEAGRALLEEVYQVLRHLERGIKEAQCAGRGERGQVVIGYINTVLHTILPETVRRFRERFPAVEVVLQEQVSPPLEQQVIEGGCDMAFLFLEGQESLFPELTRETLYTEPIVVALPKAHRLATCSNIPLRALENEPFVMYARRRKPYTYDRLIALCHEAGFSPIIAQEAAGGQAVLSLVAAGVGVALTAGSLKEVHAREITYRPLIEPEVGTDVAMVWREDGASPQVQAFLTIARKVVHDLALQ